MFNRWVDAAVQAVMLRAQTQHGVITRAQMHDCGLSRPRQDELIRLGVLCRVFRGVFALAGRPLTRWSEAVAASLACGPDVVVSHTTAALIHQFPAVPRECLPEVTVAPSRRPRPAGVVTHRAALDARDVEKRSGIPVTRTPRTLVDIASRFERADLARLVDEGVIKRLWTINELLDVSRRAGLRGKSGGAQLRSVLRERSGEPQAESQLELRMIRVLRGFRPFETNFQLVLDGSLLILDIAWPQRKAALEIDGFETHGQSRTKFDRDRLRGNLLLLHGWRVGHVTSTMTSDAVVELVSSMLR